MLFCFFCTEYILEKMIQLSIKFVEILSIVLYVNQSEHKPAIALRPLEMQHQQQFGPYVGH